MILVDDRSGSSELAAALGSPHVVTRLEYADFCWSGEGPEGMVSIGVERKALLDFIGSMTTGRLSGHQLIGLTSTYDHIYVIVEGIWRPNGDGILTRFNKAGKWKPASQGSRHFHARDIYNFMTSLQILCNVNVIRTGDKWETCKWLDSTYGWWQKPWTAHKSHLQFHRPVQHAQLTKPNLVTRVASQFDGIGWDKARKLGEEFTLEEFMMATRDDLMSVDGIGKVLADSIITQRRRG